MKYQEEYNKTKNKKEFIELVLKNYPKLKYVTANRRYYDYHKNKIDIKHKYPKDEKIEPEMLKKLLIQDAKRFGYKITREFLQKYGFKPYEINWLEEHNELDEVDEDVVN